MSLPNIIVPVVIGFLTSIIGSKKLILTNRFLPRFLTGQTITISKDQQYQYPTLKRMFPLKNSIVFTSWPMPREVFVQKTDLEQLPKKYNLMYQIKPNMLPNIIYQ